MGTTWNWNRKKAGSFYILDCAMACMYLYSQVDLLFYFHLTRIWLYYDVHRVCADRFMLNCSIFYVYFGYIQHSTTYIAVKRLKWKELLLRIKQYKIFSQVRFNTNCHLAKKRVWLKTIMLLLNSLWTSFEQYETTFCKKIISKLPTPDHQFNKIFFLSYFYVYYDIAVDIILIFL